MASHCNFRNVCNGLHSKLETTFIKQLFDINARRIQSVLFQIHSFPFTGKQQDRNEDIETYCTQKETGKAMKILLIGEYSNVHWTLAEGLRSLGHTVCVVSNVDFWKDYKRDISLVRKYTKTGGVKYLLKTYALLPRLRRYDVVQLINPMFLELKAERIAPIYRYLKRHNNKIFLGAFGMDTFWVNACKRRPHIFRYSDFNIGDKEILNDYTKEQVADWQGTAK